MAATPRNLNSAIGIACISSFFRDECQIADEEAMAYAKACCADGYDVVASLNTVEDDEWEAFVPKKGHRKRILARLKEPLPGEAPVVESTASMSPEKEAAAVEEAAAESAASEEGGAGGKKKAEEGGADGEGHGEGVGQRSEDECEFWFVLADKLRECKEETLPSHQEFRRTKPDWIVKKKISLLGACKGEYTSEYMAISHRWETPEKSDSTGEQLQAICGLLGTRTSVKFVWLDEW